MMGFHTVGRTAKKKKIKRQQHRQGFSHKGYILLVKKCKFKNEFYYKFISKAQTLQTHCLIVAHFSKTMKT